MPHPRPKAILETNGRTLHGPEHKYRILDTESGKKGHDAVGIYGGKHVWLCRHICQTKTSQSGPNTDSVEKMSGNAF